ncbi:hypothetical protein CS5676_0027 [Clostridium phage phiCs5676-1]|nr:hypothetical protein CS5676_0027 [Clostridium phage phiCs5676-1]
MPYLYPPFYNPWFLLYRYSIYHWLPIVKHFADKIPSIFIIFVDLFPELGYYTYILAILITFGVWIAVKFLIFICHVSWLCP